MFEDDDPDEGRDPEDVVETDADAEDEEAEAAESDDDTEDEEAESSGDDEDEGEDPEAEPEPKPKRKRNKVPAKTRIKQLTAQKRALEAQLKAKEPKREPLVAPNKDDYEDYEDYVAAKARYDVRSELDKEERERTEYEAERIRIERVTSFQESLNDVRDKYEDFDEVAFDDDLLITETMGEAIMTSEAGGELAYYLGKHPAEAAQIAAMQSPVAQAAAMGRLEQKLLTPKTRKPSKAPPPIGERKRQASGDDMSTEDLAKYLGLPD